MTGAVGFPLGSKPSVKSYRTMNPTSASGSQGDARRRGTHIEVENLTGDHHGEELFSGSWKSIADGLTNVHGDLGDSSKLFRALLLDFVRTRDRHDMERREVGVEREMLVRGW